jgi:phospholipase/carboxylesterase
MASLPSLALVSLLAVVAATPCVHAMEAAKPAVLKTITSAPDTLSRENAFIHRLFTPEKPSGRTIILLHGSGGDETTLAKLAASIAPDATLIGIRGRVVQNGIKRWYKRITATEFDQQDVRSEADAFATFLAQLAKDKGIDLSAATFLGYSNGANLIAALTQLHPGIVRTAVLLRAMPVLSDAAKVDLSSTRVLTIAGEKDNLYFPYAPALAKRLSEFGANVDARTIGADHGIGEADMRIVAEWLGNPAK